MSHAVPKATYSSKREEGGAWRVGRAGWGVEGGMWRVGCEGWLEGVGMNGLQYPCEYDH